MFDDLGIVLQTARSTLAEVAELSEPHGSVQPQWPSESECIDLIRELEDLKAAAAAAQARLSVDLVSARERALERAKGPEQRVSARRAVRSTAAEVALARRESPHRGSRQLGLARALTTELPHTFRALQRGQVSEWRATLICRETACLSREDRIEVDRRLAADTGGTDGWGDRRLADAARKLAYTLDPHAVVDRAARARNDRHVSVRPAPDTMTWLSALLPVEHGVACYAALKRIADTAMAVGDDRSRGQIMADTLVERLTGRSAADPAEVQVKLVLTDRTLLQGGPEPAHLEGYGTVPAQWARDRVRDALSRAAVFVRQLYTHPVTGALVAMASRSRRAPTGLADLIATRDQTCRTPWCDAPIRHTDHARPAAMGGKTDGDNLQGLCEACNQAKEAPGWRTRPGPSGMRHLVVTTTPTGHSYRSLAPPPPGHRRSVGEMYVASLTGRIAPAYRCA
ncbi:HNH endonuclease [Nocardioides terrisoli]|uniref:HNH endonuclease n=1 Tax=Nocardioides terrisoli TaxID=3388267 RepID=UPI00287BBAA6|nr:DUF222 domain-containing protein [Nocardioides marmorisolisilvae]